MAGRYLPRLALLGVFNPEWAREIHWDDDMNHVYALHVSATEVKETGKKFLGKYFLYGNVTERDTLTIYTLACA